jgi:hypothetical protein
MSTLIFVGGNVVLQAPPAIRWLGRFVRDAARGGSVIPWTLTVEAIGVALIVAIMVALQGKKTTFV